jgi:hypothetical protein
MYRFSSAFWYEIQIIIIIIIIIIIAYRPVAR